jgi:hypothetical protein
MVDGVRLLATRVRVPITYRLLRSPQQSTRVLKGCTRVLDILETHKETARWSTVPGLSAWSPDGRFDHLLDVSDADPVARRGTAVDLAVEVHTTGDLLRVDVARARYSAHRVSDVPRQPAESIRRVDIPALTTKLLGRYGTRPGSRR